MKKILWALHALFVMAGVAAVWVLSLDAPGSHPPPGVFIPLVVLVWLLLHLLIAIVQLVLWRGEIRLPDDKRGRRWPAGLIVAVIVYLIQLGSTPGLVWKLFTDFKQWSVMDSLILAQLLFAVFCLVTVLLRWPVARYLAGAGILAMVALPVYYLFLTLSADHSYSISHYAGYIPSILLVGLGIYLLRSAKVQKFFRG